MKFDNLMSLVLQDLSNLYSIGITLRLLILGRCDACLHDQHISGNISDIDSYMYANMI